MSRRLEVADKVVVLERRGDEEQGVERHAYDGVGIGPATLRWCEHHPRSMIHPPTLD